MLYAHVYALLYAGVVAAGTCITHVPRPPGWSVALPDERNPSANAGSRKVGRGRVQTLQCPHPRPWRGAGCSNPYTCDWTKLGLELDYEG